MRSDNQGVHSINWSELGLKSKCLLNPGNLANGALTGNNVIIFPVVGFTARVDIITAGAVSSGVLNGVLEHSDDGVTYENHDSQPDQQGASLFYSYEIPITKKYLRLNGNVGGTSSALKVAAVVMY